MAPPPQGGTPVKYYGGLPPPCQSSETPVRSRFPPSRHPPFFQGGFSPVFGPFRWGRCQRTHPPRPVLPLLVPVLLRSAPSLRFRAGARAPGAAGPALPPRARPQPHGGGSSRPTPLDPPAPRGGGTWRHSGWPPPPCPPPPHGGGGCSCRIARAGATTVRAGFFVPCLRIGSHSLGPPLPQGPGVRPAGRPLGVASRRRPRVSLSFLRPHARRYRVSSPPPGADAAPGRRRRHRVFRFVCRQMLIL